MTALKKKYIYIYIVGAGDHRCPDGVNMTALKYIASVVLPRSAKTIVQIYPCNLWATWRKVRISRKKGCFAKQAGKRDNRNGVCTVLFRRERGKCSTVLF